MTIMGAGMLWPYTTLISVPEYFKLLYPSANLEFWIPSVLNYPNLVILFLMVWYGDKVSLRLRIMLGFSVFMIIQLAIGFVGMLAKDRSTNTGPLAGTITLVFIGGVATAASQSSLFGFAGIFPPLYTQALMGGNGIAGLFVTLTRVATKLAYPDTDKGTRDSAFLFFILSTVVCGICLCLFALVAQIKFAQYFLERNDKSRRSNFPIDPENLDQPLMKESMSSVWSKEMAEAMPRNPIDFKGFGKRIWKIGAVVMGVLTATFLVFPGFTSELKSHSNFCSDDWFTLILFLEFNFFDLIGRMLPSVFSTFPKEYLPYASLARFIFTPLFLINPSVPSDVYIFIVMAIFAASNGYFASIAMMEAPSYVLESEREHAGFAMSCFLNLGIFLGSHLALIIKYTE